MKRGREVQSKKGKERKEEKRAVPDERTICAEMRQRETEMISGTDHHLYI
jgi:hypothetical protein